MENDRDVVLATRGLTRHYRMGEVTIQALRGVDLELHRSELIVMLGASGSGKSTLLNILGGLDRASSGTVHYGDSDLTHASQRQLTTYRRHHVGFVFQFYNLIASLTARENVAMLTSSPPSASWEAAACGGKEGDSYGAQARHEAAPESLRWVPAAGGLTAPLTSQANRACPALNTFMAPT